MKLHHQITGSHLERQAKSSSFERVIKKPPHEAKRAFYSVPETNGNISVSLKFAVSGALKSGPKSPYGS